MRTFSVLIRREPGLSDWIAHCLDWDLVSQGSTPIHALAMISESIQIVAEEDARAVLDPDDRPSADEADWRDFQFAQAFGERVAGSQVDELPIHGNPVIAVVLHYRHADVSARRGEDVPLPPFLIAKLTNGDNHRAA